jgi:MinD superfamily P-loop ATPase
MKQLVILSGKGGTGKTSVAASFAHLASINLNIHRAILLDADVDAANLELMLSPKIIFQNDFWGGKVADIDEEICEGCGICADICRFNAVVVNNGHYTIDQIACDGCAACFYQCPEDAIDMLDQIAGEWYFSESRYGSLFHAFLHPAQENSGKLVSLIKQQPRFLAVEEGQDLMLVDGPPGIGCPVISVISGADLALIVAEPSVSGIHDMHRIIMTCQHFGVPFVVCINKADLYSEGCINIEKFCTDERIEIVGKIPFDKMVTEAMVQGTPVTEFSSSSSASQALNQIWIKIVKILFKES